MKWITDLIQKIFLFLNFLVFKENTTHSLGGFKKYN